MFSWLPFGRRSPVQSSLLPAATERHPMAEALSDREAETVLGEATPFARSVREMSAQDAIALGARVSTKALTLIVRHETGGKDYYEKVYKSRPVWPEASSGVTIGFGYDLGYQTSLATVAKDWAGALPEKHIALLEPAVGLAATEPGRNDKIERIEAIVDELVGAGVTIPWNAAEAVFQRVTVPRFANITAEALPGHEVLSPDCFGALVSLTFNRGPSYDRAHDPEKDPKDRYREMRAIREAVGDGEIERIPGLIRAMKRVWAGTTIANEMNRRRENEARLFEDGIAHIAVAAADARSASVATEEVSRGLRRGPAVIDGIDESDSNAEELEELEFERRERGIDFATEVTRSAGRVGWASDDKAPDYAHLDNKLEPGIRFKLTAADLAFLAELNSFPVTDGGALPVLFGLRGCGIIEDNDGEFSDEVLLRDQRPDHDTTRCVMGVWDRAAKKIAVFEGSTVPDKIYVVKWYNNQEIGNMLPTGFYGYIVGTHNGRPGCFVLRSAPDVKRQVMVRRSKNNMIYERSDIVSKTRPGDNLHPTFSSGPTDFGSAGCQVVRGNATKGSGDHRGPWAKFRRLAGLTTATGKPGTPYVYMLLTGLEAMLAARARADNATSIPEVRESLMRLRFGSKGPRVTRLQSFLGVPGTGEFDIATSEKIYELQQRRWDNLSDGIFTPALDVALKAGVFSDLPADIAVAAPQPRPTPQPEPAQAPAPAAQPAPAPAPVEQPQPVPAAAPAVAAASSPEPSPQPKPEPVPAPVPIAQPQPAPAAAPGDVAVAPADIQIKPVDGHLTSAQADALTALVKQASARKATQAKPTS